MARLMLSRVRFIFYFIGTIGPLLKFSTTAALFSLSKKLQKSSKPGLQHLRSIFGLNFRTSCWLSGCICIEYEPDSYITAEAELSFNFYNWWIYIFGNPGVPEVARHRRVHHARRGCQGGHHQQNLNSFAQTYLMNKVEKLSNHPPPSTATLSTLDLWPILPTLNTKGSERV